MLVRRRRPWEIPARDETPEAVFRDRRRLLSALGMGGASALLSGSDALARGRGAAPATPSPARPSPASSPSAGSPSTGYPATRNLAFTLDRDLTAETLAASHNIFDEFSSDRSGVARAAAGFATDPWRIHVGGLVKSPRTFEVGELVKRLGLEERLYRHRCVEAWSMAVPWTGFPLAKLIALCDVIPDHVRYVRFISAARPDQMPGWYASRRVFPYYEALSLEEATHELAFIATGIYGHPLPIQHGAPLRLVVPWKYGFKSAKSIAALQFTEEKPSTFWNQLSPRSYSWTANVDPRETIPWPQAQETPLGRDETRPTLPFNGYGDLVAKLYA